jgi:hypothetical protein
MKDFFILVLCGSITGFLLGHLILGPIVAELIKDAYHVELIPLKLIIK